ncbi:MAG: hypothetical protein WCC04_16600 [Terriglobales bacterium]
MGKLDEAPAAGRFLNPVAVVAESEARIERLQPEARTAFAVLCAQMLMDAHLRLPKSEQRPFTLSWAPVLQVIWAGLEATDSSSAKTIVGEHLKAFYEGEFNHNLGQDGPPDADDDAAACSIYAAQVFCRGDVKSARWAASRMIDATDTTLQADTSAPSSMQVEAKRLLTALKMLESQPWTPTLIPALRAAFR